MNGSTLPVLPTGYVLHHFDEVTSTMDAARACLTGNPDLSQVVWADRQSGGRGRRGREWYSPSGNLYFTIAVPTGVPVSKAAEYSFIAALSLSRALIRLNPHLDQTLRLKWPNDVLIGEAKSAGILLETHDQGAWTLAGIGVNVVAGLDSAPYPTTSLTAENAFVPVDQLLAAVVTEFDKLRSEWLVAGFEPIRVAWLEKALALGEELSVQIGEKRDTGVFTDLSPSGALLLRLRSGEIMTVSAGDIILGPAQEE